MEVQADMRLCTVTEGLTEDAVSARLFQGARFCLINMRARLCPLHSSNSMRISQADAES